MIYAVQPETFIYFTTSLGTVYCIAGAVRSNGRRRLKVVRGAKHLSDLYGIGYGRHSKCVYFADVKGWVRVALNDPHYGAPEYPYYRASEVYVKALEWDKNRDLM